MTKSDVDDPYNKNKQGGTMLEKFEQKKLLEYLIEGLSKETTRASKYQYLYKIADAINDCFDSLSMSFNFKNCIKNKNETINKIITTYTSILKNEYDKLKNVQNSTIENLLITIQKIFNLSDIEKEVLGVIVRNEINTTFNFCLNQFNINFCPNSIIKIVTTNLKNNNKIVSSIYKLRELGLLSYDSISNDIKDLFYDDSDISRKKFYEKIIGVNLKTELNIHDFNHLKNELNIVKTIIKNSIDKKEKGINILLYGAVGTGKTELAKVVAKSLKIPIYEVICKDKDGDEASRYDRLANLKLKNSLFKNTKTKQIILFDEAEDLFTDTLFNTKTVSKLFVNKLLEENETPIIWITNDIYNMDKAYLRRFTYSVKFDELKEDIQAKFLKKEFKKNNFKISNKKILELCTKYDLASATITNSIKLIRLTNSTNDKFEDFLKNHMTLLNEGCDIQEKTDQHNNSKNYDISLVNTDFNIKDLSKKIKNTDKLNFSLCLYGEAGTGKSEYAKQLANNLGLKVVFKKASDLISMYVGETEQNIAKAFKEAKDKKALLIFDEADSFLQSRKNAEKSWEITQVNEMLTWMESHPYPFVCTTNFMDSLDEASLRRFTFKIKFNYMTAEQVKQGFKHFFDKTVDIDFANIKGLTAGDFATVKKKIDFLGTNDIKELKMMLEDEVKVKKSKELTNSIGF